jgi:beta-glucosidase
MLEVSQKNDTINISLNIKNVGKVSGKEVVQFYTEKLNSKIHRPTQELKAFTKTKLIEPEAMERVSVKIPIRELSYWDEKKNDWALEKGSYNIKVGASSRDIRQIEQLKF